MSEYTLKVYVDTAFLSRLYDERIGKDEADAWERIAEAKKAGRLDLVVSKYVWEEIQNTEDPRRKGILSVLYTLFGEVDAVSTKGMFFVPGVPGGLPGMGMPVFYEKPEVKGLNEIFDKEDAEHIYQARQSGCQYFLTRDWATILDRVPANQERLEELCPGLCFVSPVELANVLQGIPASKA